MQDLILKGFLLLSFGGDRPELLRAGRARSGSKQRQLTSGTSYDDHPSLYSDLRHVLFAEFAADDLKIEAGAKLIWTSRPARVRWSPKSAGAL